MQAKLGEVYNFSVAWTTETVVIESWLKIWLKKV